MSWVDVLAVLDEHIGHYAVLQQLARDEGNNHYADELEEHCGTLTQLRFARAAVAELIEADDEFDKCRAELRDLRIALGHNNPLHQDTPHLLRYEAAAKRRAAALSRVRGAA